MVSYMEKKTFRLPSVEIQVLITLIQKSLLWINCLYTWMDVWVSYFTVQTLNIMKENDDNGMSKRRHYVRSAVAKCSF